MAAPCNNCGTRTPSRDDPTTEPGFCSRTCATQHRVLLDSLRRHYGPPSPDVCPILTGHP